MVVLVEVLGVPGSTGARCCCWYRCSYYYCLVTLGGQTVLLDLHFNLLHYIQVILKQSGSNGGAGVTIKCTKGVYWAQQGIVLHVSDVAVSGKFRISNGTEITNTANIERGYKAGYNIIQTAGVGQKLILLVVMVVME